MVFESVVTEVLNKVLGDYVENLDRKQLSIGIWGGDVVLNNLKLRENALDELDLPIQLVYGFLGKLVLNIPWKNLYSQPVVAQIENLHVLAAPKVVTPYNEEKEEKYELDAKQATLRAMQEAHKRELAKDKPKPDATFSEKLTAQIVNNLQVKIANLHIRYEDSTATGKPFAFGVTLHNLELYTTDANWEKCYMAESASRVFKVAVLDCLSVYMNCTAQLYTEHKKAEMAQLFTKNIARKELLPNNYSFIVGPISSMAKLQLNMNPEYDVPAYVIPKIDLFLEMNKLNVALTCTQFQYILKVVDLMTRLQLGAPYRKYRPFNIPYKGNYKKWWKFAITCVLDDVRKRLRSWDWDHISEHRALCKNYAEKFKERELSKKPGASLNEACSLLEQKLDLFNLILIRQRVQIEVEKIREHEEKNPTQKGWFGGWFGGGTKSPEHSNDIAQKFEAAMTPEEKKKLYKAIGYQENSAPKDIPVAYVGVNTAFKLLALEIGLYDDTKVYSRTYDSNINLDQMETIMLLKFSKASCYLKQRPAVGAVSITLGMKEIRLTGLRRGKYIPMIIESKVTNEYNLLDVFFETAPIDNLCDKRLKLQTRPLQIIYDAQTIVHLSKVFSPPKNVNLAEIEAATTQRMNNIKERSATGMQYLIESRDVVDVDIKLMPTIIIVPSSGTYIAKEKTLIVLSLGQLQVLAKPRKYTARDIAEVFESHRKQDEILKLVMERAYDRVQLELDKVQLMVVRPQEPWEDTVRTATLSEMHILRPTSIKITADLCVVSDDPRLPKTKLDILLPSIHINATEDRLFGALHVVTSLPMPESAPEEPVKPVIAKSLSTASSRISLFLSETRKTKPLLIQEAISEDVVQYTNLVMSFALKEFSVTLCKPCRTDDTPTEKFVTPVDETPTEQNSPEEFADSNSEILSPTPSESEQHKILSFKILRLEGSLVQRSYDMVATAKLGAINLEQFDSCDVDQPKLTVIDTPSFDKRLEYLLTVSYTAAQKSSPIFVTKYNSTEQLIEINFSTLNITLHQEYLQQILEMSATIQCKLALATRPSQPSLPADRIGSAGDDNIISRLTTITEDEEFFPVTSTRQSARNKRQAAVVDSIKTNIRANLEQVSLSLTCRKRALMSLNIKQFNAGVIVKTSYTQLNFLLKDIRIIDPNPRTIHTNILSIVGNDALNGQVVLYNVAETADYNSDDIKISVQIGCMKIVFLNWFVSSVLNFLNNFQAAQKAIADASAAAAETAQQKALDVYEKATRIKLDVRIKAPIIIVPMDSQSRQAIALDLGFLQLSNVISDIEVKDSEMGPAVLDDIQLELKNMKLSKVFILDSAKEEKPAAVSTVKIADTTDFSYGIKENVNIMDPITFILNVKRNLSSRWYREVPEINVSGRLKSIELNLFSEDYALIMSIMNKNLSEGAGEFDPTEAEKAQQRLSCVTAAGVVVHRETSHTLETSPSRATRATLRKSTASRVSANRKVYEQLRFTFLFDGVIANFMLGPKQDLAQFGIYYLSVKGKKLEDGTLSVSMVLCNVQIDDQRASQRGKITKYLCRKDWKKRDLFETFSQADDILEACRKERNYMVDITAIVKEDDTFAEVKVCGFDLILCIDFLLKLSAFFTIPQAPESPVEVKTDAKPVPVKVTTAPKAAPASPNPNGRMNLMLHIEEPDIILIETLNNMDANAIIFNMQMKINYRTIGEKQLINGRIDSLKMYLCSFQPQRREATKHYILHPCVISLQGSTPEEEGLHIYLKFSEIIINVSPATIELFNKAMATISAGNVGNTHDTTTTQDYKKIWSSEKFKDHDHWFVRADEAREAEEQYDEDTLCDEDICKTEKCIIELPCVTIVIEMGVGYYTTPLISIDTKMNAVISEWSRDMSVNGSLTLNMNYFNQRLATWEPIIEMNERVNRLGESEYFPWELGFNLSIETKKSEFDEELEEKTTNIKIQSSENLEVTVSKRFLEAVGVLKEAFTEAIDAKGLYKPDIIAPFVVQNDTGFDVTLNFRHGIFTLHECHTPKFDTHTNLNETLVLQVDKPNFVPDDVQECKIPPEGRAYLQTKELSALENPDDEEYLIFVKVGDIKKELILPVSKSDERYFALFKDTMHEPWGIVSEVRSEYGTTIINIHGILRIHNHFTTTLKIYRNRSLLQTNKILVGEVKPGKVFNVPLHAIYSEYKDLYFTIEGYNVSVQGIRWNDSPTDLEYTRRMQCDPIKTFEPFYINAIREKKEIYYEHTNKFKLHSVLYTINLRPPLYLCNALPFSIKVSVAGCSVRQDLNKTTDILNTFAKDLGRRHSVKEDFLDYGEKDIRPGDVLHLPTVKLTGKGKESKTHLVVRLMQYLEKNWSCTTPITEEPEDNLAVWTFSSYDSAAKMDLDLCVRYDDRYGSLILTLFSPFWMINKTGNMLSYKTDTETLDVLYHPPEYQGPILLSFREKFFFDKKRAVVRVDNGAWSEKIPLDVAGAIGSVTCKANEMQYQIGVHNHLTYNSLTKQITFIPFYMVTNKCNYTVELQEQSRPGDPWLMVAPYAVMAFWPKDTSNNLAVARVRTNRTVPFNFTEVQCTLLKLSDSIFGGVNVDVQVTEGGVYINFAPYNPGDAPGLLINHTSHAIVLKEKGQKAELLLSPRRKVLYTWHAPTGEKLIRFGKKGKEVENDLRRDGIGEFMFDNGKKAFWVSFLDGLQRVLLFTEVEAIAKKSETSMALQSITQSIEVSIHGIGLSIINNDNGVDVMYLGITSSGIIWESKKENKRRFRQMNIHDTALVEAQYQQFLIDKAVEDIQTYSLEGKYKLDFENWTMYKQHFRPIRRTFLPGVWLSMKTSPFQSQIHAKINKIQLDNQLQDYIFPVVLSPVAPPKSVSTQTTWKPFVECSIVQRVVPNSNVQQFKYASVLIQEFHVKVDLGFLSALADMFASVPTDEQAAKLFSEDVDSIDKPLSALVETRAQQEQKNFYDNLHLGPIKIHVSFSLATSDTVTMPSALATLLQGVGVTLTEVNDVVFRLAFFEREYQFLTQKQLTSEIVAHYAGQALKQLYVLVLGLDVLGNPFGLVVGIKKGVEDLFYEPFQGAIQGPGEFAEGLVLGVKSLFGHTVGGAAGAVSKITGAMGKGLAVLTFDEDYQKKRRQALTRKPQNFQEGIARSGRGLVMGFVDGVTGVVTKPVAGAREDGVEGFFKGLGKGAIGLVTRPTAGVVDFASGSLDAVKRATEAQADLRRLRPPRYLQQDNVLRAYCRAQAEGNKMLRDIEKGKYATTDTFIHCEEVIQKHEYVIVSNHRAIYVTKNDLFGTWTLQWTYLWHDIGMIVPTNRGVEITLKKDTKKVMGIFSANEPPRKLILLPSKERREKLTDIMESQRREL